VEPMGQGLPYIAGALAEKGHEVYGLNLNYRWCLPSAPLALEIELRKAILQYRPQLIGIGGLSVDYPFIRDTIYFARRIDPNIPIVCGGGIITHDGKFVFNALKPDFAIVGDAERSISRLTDALERNTGAFATVPNLLFWDNTRPQATLIEPIESLDDLPYPDYKPFDVERFLNNTCQGDRWLTAYRRSNPRIMSISLARSCRYKCTFCCHKSARNYRWRSIENAVGEISLLYEKYRFNTLTVYDELFFSGDNRLEKFCHAILDLKKRTRMDFDWTCSLRVTDINERTASVLKLMKESGCYYVSYGIESGSQKILDSMRKGITVADTRRAMRLTDEAGLGVQGCLIIGDPAETSETLNETVEFYQSHCDKYLINFSYVTPYPGSEIFDYCVDKGVIPGREAYYADVKSISRRAYNMTSMDDDVFIRSTARAIEKSNHSRYEAKVRSCTRDSSRACDIEAPFNARRDLFRIELDCPHCSANISRLYPIVAGHIQALRLPCVCDACNRRFDAVFQEEVLPVFGRVFEETKLPDHILQPIYVGDPEVLFNFRGSSLVRFTSKIYVLPHALGSVNLHSEEQRNQPGILAADTIEQALALVLEK
jgi:anaerobic magnesium-protoporphyrin IX monomethyl ester cyclase